MTAAEREGALAAAEDAQPERTARRRAKMLPPGARPVDVRDLPLNETYLAAANGTGAVLRVREGGEIVNKTPMTKEWCWLKM